jgi:5,10-methenyltetrahydromethanopterin hydrogenase
MEVIVHDVRVGVAYNVSKVMGSAIVCNVIDVWWPVCDMASVQWEYVYGVILCFNSGVTTLIETRVGS